jgi:hypothetical protein
MLNLQSIVEELGIHTSGKAWVVCTSQEAIDEVVKSERFKRNDFSKILGRFDTKIKLASTDIEEVIKARLLEKTDTATDTLRARYEQDGADIRNAFSFSAGTQTQKLYKDTDDFVATYPYIPFQFALVQNTYTYIRTKGFAGAHLSSGARSLLSAIQETAIKNEDAEIGALIPFSAFYDTISTAALSNNSSCSRASYLFFVSLRGSEYQHSHQVDSRVFAQKLDQRISEVMQACFFC